MPLFNFRAANADGKTVKGTIRAATPERARVVLEEKNYTSVRVIDGTRPAKRETRSRRPDANPLADPPRDVPFPLCIRLLFGGAANQVAWASVALVAALGAMAAGSDEIPPLEGGVPWLLAAGAVSLLTFPLVGLFRGLKGVRLLRHGRHSRGVLVDREGAPSRSGNVRDTIFKLTYEFQTHEGVLARTVVSTAWLSDPSLIEDEEHEPLLYDPREPSRAILLDVLPGGPRIDEQGRIRSQKPGKELLWLVLPATAVAFSLQCVVQLCVG